MSGAGAKTGALVLVVDDEAVVRDGVRRVLEADGLRVETAADATAAQAHPAAATCDLVVCDLMLPDRSGLDLLQHLRRARPDLAMVLITGYATADHVQRAQEVGASDFLAKPFTSSELLTVVREALRGRTVPAEERRS
jgi:DNA-binding NtrC family response regulator